MGPYLARVGLLLAGVVVGLGVAEFTVRLGWEDTPIEARSTTPDDGLPELTSLFDLARPNARGRFTGAFYRSNSAGFRGPDYSELPRSDTFRIVVAGDSVTMGSGVLEEEAYPSRLEDMLNARAQEGRYEVLNIGLSGLPISNVANRIENIGLRFNPDLLVYGFTPNDIELTAYRATVTVPERRAERAKYYTPADSRFYLLRVIYPRIVGVRDLLFAGPGSYVYDLNHNYFQNPEAWQQFAAGLDRIAAIGRNTGVCVHVLIHTQLYAVNFLHPFTRIYDKVATAARERGLTVTDALPYFRQHDEKSLTIAVDDPHPNGAGHAILARALLDGLSALPQSCFASRSGKTFRVLAASPNL